MAQNDISGTQPERRANPRYIIIEFSKPVTDDVLEDVERNVGESYPRAELIQCDAAYDDGWGHLIKTAPLITKQLPSPKESS